MAKLKSRPKKRKLEDFKKPVTDAEYKALQEELRIEKQKVFALSTSGKKYRIRSAKRRTYKCALTSDWHIGSLCANEEALVAFYQYAVSQGVRDFYCSGDILDGHGIYRGQTFELRDVGFDRQLDALVKVVKQFPKSAKTHFITGNHDASFSKKIGLAVGPQIEANCHNFSFVGADFGQIVVNTPNSDIRIALIHPDGGTAYALSYKSQKIIESWEGGQKPHILGIGHFHKAEFMPKYRNVKALQAGCFQEQTPFMKRKSLASHVGAWILEITMGELCNQIKTEFVEFF